MTELYCGDCLDLMQRIPDKSVDMVLCDLPYGMTRCKWDVPLPLDKLWEQYRRVCKDNAAVVLFGAMPFTARLVCSNERDFRYMWVWDKHYKRGFLNAKKQPLRQTENICVFYRAQCKYNPEMRTGKLRTKGNSNKDRGVYGKYAALRAVNAQYYPTDILDFPGVPVSELYRSTQKPVALLEYLIRTYTDTGDVVLDNCMGTGSTGVAAVNMGRRFVGIELEPECFEIACRRIVEVME